jgi:hypothetical protein
MSFLDQLTALEPACTPAEAFALFDALPTVKAEEILGGWIGRELATGHPLDGHLVASGWYGKRFDDVESVHPLLFRGEDGNIFAGDPIRMPLGLVAKINPKSVEKLRRKLRGIHEPAMKTKKYRARLRNLEFRGAVSAAMVYDQLPIIDIFRQVDGETLLGAMDQRGAANPYFFILTRAKA